MDSLPSEPLCHLYTDKEDSKHVRSDLTCILLFHISLSIWEVGEVLHWPKNLNKLLVNPIQICFVVNFLLIIFIFLLHILFLYILWLESRTLRSWIGYFVLINQKPWIIETISQNQVRKKENSFIPSNKSFKNKVQPIFNISAWMYVPMKMYEA